ncbi:MAG: dipeptidase PepV [Methanomicrobiales archaeon]|nr:dipeptidase PepV [Methanomicrobiales archaeon]
MSKASIEERWRQAIDRSVDAHAGRLVAAVQELVRIRSVADANNPGGGPAEALAAALAIAGDLGFATVNHDGCVGYAEYGTGDAYVAVLGHLDVVPEGEHWTYPPFAGEIHGGRIYGRGALDDKGPVLAALFGLQAVAESGMPLARRVRVIFGTTEETNGPDIAFYLSREPPPVAGFTPDAQFPVVFAEKGLLWIELEKRLDEPGNSGVELVRLSGGTAANMVPDAASAELATRKPASIIKRCTAYAKRTGYALLATATETGVVITSEGVAAHASMPETGRNAVMQLVQFLATLHPAPPAAADALRFLAAAVGMETDGGSFGLALSDAPSGGLTLNAGKIALSETSLAITLDIRHPVTVPKEEVTARIAKTLAGTGFSMRILKYDSPLFFPMRSPVIRTLSAVYREATGERAPPVAIGGGTYARRLPNIVAFGPYRPGTTPPIHGRDECIAVDELVALAKIYARAIAALAR